MITYEPISLFDAPTGAFITHACNAQGVWGSGIAKEFKARYPKAFEVYHDQCKKYNALGRSYCGNFHISEKHKVTWIITSENYGDKKDTPIAILANTVLAVNELCQDLDTERVFSGQSEITVYSNKFNSGLFNVPWEQTEEVLKQVLKRYSRINWVVCYPNMKSDDWS